MENSEELRRKRDLEWEKENKAKNGEKVVTERLMLRQKRV